MICSDNSKTALLRELKNVWYILNIFLANVAIKLISKEFTIIKDFTKIDYELEPSLSGSSVNFVTANSELVVIAVHFMCNYKESL